MMQNLLNSARQRCLVVSHKIAAKAAIRLAPLLSDNRQAVVPATILYDELLLDDTHLETLHSQLAERGAQLSRQRNLHTKCIVVDQSAIISNFNFLSADPFNKATNAREVGLLIQGGELPSLLFEKFTALATARRG
jgi:hypothetical protein